MQWLKTAIGLLQLPAAVGGRIAILPIFIENQKFRKSGDAAPRSAFEGGAGMLGSV
jgi:hypothetical protein